MIIVISNRKVKQDISGGVKMYAPEILGRVMTVTGKNTVSVYARDDDGDDMLRVYPEDNDVKSLFETIRNDIANGNEKLKRPWVFFVHGNNQNIHKNLAKAKKIQNIHNVNVIAFSWPSQPTGKGFSFWKFASGFLLKVAFLGPTSITGADFFKKIGKTAYDYYENYMEARKNAVISVDYLIDSMNLVNEHLFEPLGDTVRHNLLFHSLGHRILRVLIDDEDKQIPIPSFTNIVLHQADAKSENHHRWVSKLSPLASNKLYLTTNTFDVILSGSYFVNREERLGHTATRYSESDAVYLNFTDGEWVDNQHNFFNMKVGANLCNDDVARLFSRILNGHDDELPTGNETKNGFILKDSQIPLYELEYKPEDDEGD